MGDDGDDQQKGWGPFKAYPKEATPESPWALRDAGPEAKNSPRESLSIDRTSGRTADGYRVTEETTRYARNDPAVERTVGVGPLYQREFAGALLTTKKSVADKSFISLGHVEGTFSALAASYDVEEKKAELTVVEAKGRVAVIHAEVDAVDAIKRLFGWNSPPPAEAPAPTVAGGGAPFAARVSDPTSHGAPLSPGIGSPNVIIGGLPAWRANIDVAACPVVKGGVPDAGGTVLKGAPSVLINGMMACRMGDVVTEVPGGTNTIVGGCPSVTFGQASPTVSAGPSCVEVHAAEEAKPWLKPELKATGDVLTAEGEASLGAKVDLKELSGGVEGNIGVSAAVFRGDVSGGLGFRIPFTDHYVSVGAKAEGSAISAGIGAHAGMVVNGKDPTTGRHMLFKTDVGAKAELGLGAALGFSLSIE
jgi:uncharacterized Zn-binding protein involved in type VI secretion